MSQYVKNLIAGLCAHSGEDMFHVLAHQGTVGEYVRPGSDVATTGVSERLRNPILNVAWHQLGLPAVCRRQRLDVLFLPAASRRMPVHVPCPTVGTVHDLTPFRVSGKYGPARMFYQTRVLPALFKRLTRIIAISESTKRDIVEFAGVPDHRISVIPHGVDTGTFYPDDRDAAAGRLRDIGVRSPYLVYVSRIEHPGKNHVRLIQAFERIKSRQGLPHQLVLAGADWNRADEVRKAARESAVGEDILFAGFVHDRHLPDLYRGADMLVFPSLFEGFGLPILEAMACGLPVACSNVSSMPEIAGDAAVLFDPLDVESIVESLDMLLCSPGRRAASAREGLERASLFNWAATARKTLEVIHQAARESCPDPGDA